MRAIRYWQRWWGEWKADCINFNAPLRMHEAFIAMVRDQIARLLCKLWGHRLIDESYGNPETGCIDMYCERCDWGYHQTLY